MAETKEKPDRTCIRDFAKFLQEIGQPVSGVDDWPEDRAQGEIDAILGPYALQHTSVDALPDKRRIDRPFDSVIAGVQDEFRGRLGFRLSITFDWNCIQKGQNWTEINQALREWISQEAPYLPDGRAEISSIPGIPFTFDVSKGCRLRSDGVYFARLASHDRSLSIRLHDQLVGRHNKLGVLGKYRSQGKTTLLLLESDDIAFMSDDTMATAFRDAFPIWPEELDELWFIHRVARPAMNVHDLRRGHTWIFDPTQSLPLVVNMQTASV